MNIGSLGIVAGAAAQLNQARVTEVDRLQKDNAAQERVAESAHLAEEAEGVGVTHEESATGERDADGRLPWQLHGKTPPSDTDDSSPATEPHEPPHHAKDPSGQSGTLFDLDG